MGTETKETTASDLEVLKFKLEEFSSGMAVPHVRGDIRHDIRWEVDSIIASFKALMRADADINAPEFGCWYQSWWDHLKGEHLSWLVEKGILKPPAFRHVRQVFRFCPHIAVPGNQKHVEFMMMGGL